MSIFACGLRLHRKTYPPILARLFLCHFPQITSAKMQVCFLAASFPNKAFVFSNNGISKVAFAARAGSGKPALLHALFLENKKQNRRKNYRAVFSCEVQGHMQNSTHLEATKRGPKKSFTMFMHAHRQMI